MARNGDRTRGVSNPTAASDPAAVCRTREKQSFMKVDLIPISSQRVRRANGNFHARHDSV